MLRKCKTWIAAHTVITTIVVCMAISGAAFAAWVVFTGAQGNGTAVVGSSSISQAVQLNGDYDPAGGDVSLVPGGTPGTVDADLVNLDGAAAHTVTSLTLGSVSATPTCNTAGITYTPNPAVIGAVGTGKAIPAGGELDKQKIGTISAPSSLDPACANAVLSLHFTGTTSP